MVGGKKICCGCSTTAASARGYGAPLSRSGWSPLVSLGLGWLAARRAPRLPEVPASSMIRRLARVVPSIDRSHAGICPTGSAVSRVCCASAWPVAGVAAWASCAWGAVAAVASRVRGQRSSARTNVSCHEVAQRNPACVGFGAEMIRHLRQLAMASDSLTRKQFVPHCLLHE